MQPYKFLGEEDALYLIGFYLLPAKKLGIRDKVLYDVSRFIIRIRSHIFMIYIHLRRNRKAIET